MFFALLKHFFFRFLDCNIEQKNVELKFHIPSWSDSFEMFENFAFALFFKKDQMFKNLFCFRISNRCGFRASSPHPSFRKASEVAAVLVDVSNG